MTVRPRLKPACRVLVRSDGSVHLGPSARSGVVITGLTPPEREFLALLDGTRETGEVIRDGRRLGVTEHRAHRLLEVLREHHLTVATPTGRWDFSALPSWVRGLAGADAAALSWLPDSTTDGYAALRARAARRGLVTGAGPLGSAIAALLVRAGVGDVEHGAGAADALDWPAGARAGQGHLDVVVMVVRTPVGPGATADWQSRGVPHLPVEVSPTGAVVGPLVIPGTTPCVGCLDLTRTDIDPSWPALRAQLDARRGRDAPVDAETTLSSITAGLAAAAALAHLDGAPAPRGTSLHVDTPWPLVRHQVWRAHPCCPCGAAASQAPRAEGGDTGPGGAATRGRRVGGE